MLRLCMVMQCMMTAISPEGIPDGTSPAGTQVSESVSVLQAKLEDSELQVKELSRQVMALERAKVELEARNRQLESAARGGSKESPGSLAAPGTPSQVCCCKHRNPMGPD